MQLYEVTDKYINYLRTFESKVYDNKESDRRMIKKYANIIYKQKINNYDVSYIKNVVDFKVLEKKYYEFSRNQQ